MGGLEPTDGPLSFSELQLATRNRGLPLEALRYDVTPTGLHYLLTHFDIPDLDVAAWRLEIRGAVAHPRSLSLDDLRALPARTLAVTMECAGNGRARLRPRPVSQPWLLEAVSTAVWTGAPLAEVLRVVELREDAVELVFTGADHGVQGGVEQDYARSLSPGEAAHPEVLLAYKMNGRPLEPQHGAPLRLIVPGWYGMAQVKWLARIEAVTEPFQGYQQSATYRYQRGADDPGEPVSRMRVRALMIPPGHPDFMTRGRFVPPGKVELRGRAWSGEAPVESVQVGVDGVWSDAVLEPPDGEFAWRGWRAVWRATKGDHVLSCRARDTSGNVQPLEQSWNRQGMGNTQVQEVKVTVR